MLIQRPRRSFPSRSRVSFSRHSQVSRKSVRTVLEQGRRQSWLRGVFTFISQSWVTLHWVTFLESLSYHVDKQSRNRLSCHGSCLIDWCISSSKDSTFWCSWDISRVRGNTVLLFGFGNKACQDFLDQRWSRASIQHRYSYSSIEYSLYPSFQIARSWKIFLQSSRLSEKIPSLPILLSQVSYS